MNNRKLVVKNSDLSEKIREKIRSLLEKRRDRRYSAYATAFAIGAGGLVTDSMQKVLLTAGGAGSIKLLSDFEKVISSTKDIANAIALHKGFIFSKQLRDELGIKGIKSDAVRSEKKYLSENFTHIAVDWNGNLVFIKNPSIFSKAIGRKKAELLGLPTRRAPKEVKLCDFKKEDLQDAENLAAETFTKTPFNFHPDDVKEYLRNSLGLASQSKDGQALVARVSGKIVGIAIGVPLDQCKNILPKTVVELFSQGKGFYLPELFVSANWIKKGIGRLLTEARLKHAQNRGYHFALAKAHPNSIQQVDHYKKMGFTELPEEQFKGERKTFFHKMLK